jgi:hypothetical protein
MSVVFSYDSWDDCELQWISANALTDGSGNFAINWQNTARGGMGQWVAWSISSANATNAVVSLQVNGDQIIQNMGTSDGQIYSAANMPNIPTNMSVVCIGQAGPATTVYLNVLIRRPV